MHVNVMSLENPINPEFDLLTVPEVAKLLHCSKAHICNLVAGRVHGCSRLPAVRLGRRALVRPEKLWAWVEQNEAGNDNVTLLSVRDGKSA